VPGEVESKALARGLGTQIPSGTTSLPIPSPVITAILNVFMILIMPVD
jgi:hypothetical protein